MNHCGVSIVEKNLTIFLASAISIWAMHTSADSFFLTGNELQRHCKMGETDGATSFIPFGTCIGYLQGVADTIESHHASNLTGGYSAIHFTYRDVCVPPGVEAGQIKRVWMNWADKNPEKLHNTASSLVMSAFAEAWPCNSQ